MSAAPSATLADFPAADPPLCMNCGEAFPEGTAIEFCLGHVVMECRKCRLFSVFKLRKKAA